MLYYTTRGPCLSYIKEFLSTSMMAGKQYKILMLCFNASGHVNPFVCYGSELAKSKDVKVIMYNDEQHRKLIEAAGIEFRPAKMDFPADISLETYRASLSIHPTLSFFMDATEKLLPELVRCVEKEGIDLIIYDFLTVHAKWLLKYLKIKHDKGELKRPLPKALMFAASLMHQKGVYTNSFEKKFLPTPKRCLRLVFILFFFYLKYIFFCFKYGFSLEDPVTLFFYTKDALNICCVVSEFQPRSHLFPKNVHFVGNCVSEDVRGSKEIQEPLKSFLLPFEARNPLPLVNLRVDDSLIEGKEKLVYLSLGTVVNKDLKSYVTLINGIRRINESSANNFKLKFLLSTGGDVSYEKLMVMNKNKEIEIPDNLLILPRVPQLEVLQRASVFVTHSGQGGTSEAIHYGVPMVCIPVMGDQPAVAHRAASELGLGVQLSFDELSPELVRGGVLAVLSNKSYLERILLFSQISRKYNGAKEAARITMDYLKTPHKNKSD